MAENKFAVAKERDVYWMRQTELRVLLREAIELMPLGTKNRAVWFGKASAMLHRMSVADADKTAAKAAP